jgi:hypothetical protein
MRLLRLNRILESIPGSLIWATLVALVLFSWLKPMWMIYFVIAFDLYWLLRISYMLVYMLLSWSRYRQTINVHWSHKLAELGPRIDDYYHLIFLPTYKEPLSVVELPFKSLLETKYDHKKFIVVLAGEERDQTHFLAVAEQIQQTYGNAFFRLIVTVHPSNIPGEQPGKGSNTHFAAGVAHKLIDELGIPYEKVIVSNFDIDSVPHPQYFAYLTHTYATHTNPTRASYQPIAMYLNNVWESHPIIRVVASSTTFWLFTDLSRSQRLFTFSSHSMSFQALVDVGYWDATIVTEDSRIFLQCLVRYEGAYETVPLYLPIYMSTVDIGDFWRSVKNQYKQMRRWAWGVEHLPWMIRQFWVDAGPGRKVPFLQKIYYMWNLGEGMYSWATAPIIILLAGYLPLWFAGTGVRTTALFQNTPHVLAILMRASLLGLIVISVLYTIMLPDRPRHVPRRAMWFMLLQWFLTPVTLLIFGALPAIDAQTRLMLGGKFRLGFWVTEKK